MTRIIKQHSMGSFFLNRGSPVKEIFPHTHQYFPTIQNGLDYLLGHIAPPIWPRTISTHTTEGKQVLVYSQDQALTRFRQARLLDCRINAYPSYTGWKGLNRQAPNFLFIDLDLSRFKSIEALNKALKRTLKFLKEKLKEDDISPSVLWTGNGYHIYLPVTAFILELETLFAEFEEPSRQFIRWAEQFLTNNKADACHSNSLSFRNCMVRIPGSFNSKLVKLNEKIVNIPELACAELKPLDFNVNTRIKPNLGAAAKVGYLPIGFSDLKTENRQLAALISRQPDRMEAISI